MAFFRNLFAWFLSILMALGLISGVNPDTVVATATDIQQKVTENVDAMVDEAAAFADSVNAAVEEKVNEVRESEAGQKVEQFATDVREIVDNTAQDIQDHFGPEATEAPVTEETTEGAGAAS